MESESEFFQIDEVDDEELGERAEELRQASAKKEGDDRRARDAKEKAWRADTIDSPLCMRSRAEKLAGLSTVQNPHYPSVDEWHFEYARVRAQNYYLRRWQTEPAAGSSAKELQRSCARKVFYRYAYEHISSARCIEGESRLQAVRRRNQHDEVHPCPNQRPNHTMYRRRPTAPSPGRPTWKLQSLHNQQRSSSHPFSLTISRKKPSALSGHSFLE